MQRILAVLSLFAVLPACTVQDSYYHDDARGRYTRTVVIEDIDGNRVDRVEVPQPSPGAF